ncbi:outer membrane beta-barrel family protein [Pedobacter rhodius]|uniref:Outer membrane beta-barrel family protein n=1 Tax=Pedobacter rhodius TaxID=3004098 RepID=A0ABT4KS62_9SPHI|nr:outer membrane beta-barrel family protein [Pedobacter sp. SJ11]MCZ4221768.1 outer membrane beta-barrel family protein [Pedobacter sp. SJ11]
MKNFLIYFNLFLCGLNANAQKKDSTFVKKDSLKIYNLKEVTVKSAVPMVRVKTDKILMNVDAVPNAAGLNALELLRQMPGVTIDGQDNVKISGKNGVQVLLDGRIQTLNAQQLSALLKGTSSASLKAIEVISNPSAKYDAAGNAGIINLIFKTSGAYGTSGNLTAGYQKMDHYRQNSALNLNYKGAKLSAFLNGNFDNSLQFTKVSSNRILSDKVFDQNGVEQQGYSNSMVRTGLDYTFNKKHKIGTILNYQRTWDDFPSNASTSIIGNAADVLFTNTLANLTENRFSTNLNYQYAAKNESRLNVEVDWMRYSSNLNNLVDNAFERAVQQTSFKNDTRSRINLFSAKADYSKAFWKGNFESGLKFSSSQTGNELRGEQSGSTGSMQVNLYNDFDYNEKIAAAYTSFERSFGKLNIQAGLRGEYTSMKGLSINEIGQKTALPDTSYVNIFPTFFLRYQLDDKNSFGFAYSKRVNRPSFQDQNPYVYRTDFYYASQGNPLLLPQFTQSLELDYTFDGQRQLKVNYNTTRDLIEFVQTQSGDQTTVLPVNAGTRSYLNMSLSTPFKFFKIWEGYFSAEPYYQFYRADLSAYNGLAKISNGGVGFNGYLSNTVDLGKKWKAGLSTWFNYASRSSIYRTKAISSVDFSLKKTLLNDKLNLNLAMRDIFNTQKWEQTAVIGQINQSSLRKWESRGLYVGLNYNFGNTKVKNLGTKGNKTDEQERIKSRG